ncbi:hypothetical protein EPO15_02500, partial [bacterium]
MFRRTAPRSISTHLSIGEVIWKVTGLYRIYLAVTLVAVGLNHQTCPLAARERLAALGAASAREALAARGWREVVVLATCNRFEVYAVGLAAPEELERSLAAFLDAHAGGPVSQHLTRFAGAEAARHLFAVSSGLDSLVLGESEILGQVKTAYEAALESGTTGKLTNVLFQRALFVGKAVRGRTG